jgi:hypothetical protein
MGIIAAEMRNPSFSPTLQAVWAPGLENPISIFKGKKKKKMMMKKKKKEGVLRGYSLEILIANNRRNITAQTQLKRQSPCVSTACQSQGRPYRGQLLSMAAQNIKSRFNSDTEKYNFKTERLIIGVSHWRTHFPSKRLSLPLCCTRNQFTTTAKQGYQGCGNLGI